MGFAEREVVTACIDIRSNFFLVSNLQGVGFSDIFGKPITIRGSAHCPVDLTYFIFCSVVPTATVDIHAPVSSLSLEFSLRLPQPLRTSASSSAVVIKPPPAPELITTAPKPIADLSFKLGNISDDIFSAMDEDQIRTLLTNARDILFPPLLLLLFSFNLLIYLPHL